MTGNEIDCIATHYKKKLFKYINLFLEYSLVYVLGLSLSRVSETVESGTTDNGKLMGQQYLKDSSEIGCAHMTHVHTYVFVFTFMFYTSLHLFSPLFYMNLIILAYIISILSSCQRTILKSFHHVYQGKIHEMEKFR